ncbi:MAG: PAS domain S-box protein, partial [Pseudomonadota bacterium]|nr:PAS domain S-box protein [Pseudomonadota bacterium]
MYNDSKTGSSNPSCEELLQQAIKAEECCSEMQTRLDKLERISHIGSWEWIFNSNHLSWSKGTYDIFGLPQGPYNQDNYASFLTALHPEDQSMVSKAINEALEHRSLYSLDYRIIRADNRKERIIHAHAETIRDPENGEPLKMLGTIQDVTARRQGQQKLELLQSAIDHASETIVITDHQANIIYTNPAFTSITGYSQKEALGQNPRILQSGQTKPEVFSQMWQTLVAKKNWRGHFLNQKKDGSLYEEEVSITPLLDHEKRITHYIAVKRDISEEAYLRRQLQQAQKMEAIGTLAGGIAHDFNNILTILVGNLELAMMFELDENHPAQKGLGKALDAGQRAKELVSQILTFSRRQGDDFKPLKTTPIIKEAIKLINNSLSSTIKLESSIKAKQDIVMAAPAPIHQILINLCSNSAYAMRDQGGLLRIEVENLELDEKTALQYNGLKAGNHLVLRVCDTGPGIAPKIVDKIFEPYFTTKPVGQGSGLGLATIHGLVKKLNGEISMQSEVGHGCTFTILLPTLDYHETMTNSLSDFHNLPTGSEHILLVDDEKEIIELNQNALEKLGYRVSTCKNGDVAFKLVKHNPKQFDLILTDMTMPKMTGDRLAQALLKLNPEMPIILGTGHSDTINRKEALALGIKEFYNKPLS